MADETIFRQEEIFIKTVTAEEFSKAVRENEALTQKLSALNQKFAGDVKTLAAEYGYELDAQQELSDEQLHTVSGGAAVTFGNYFPPKTY